MSNSTGGSTAGTSRKRARKFRLTACVAVLAFAVLQLGLGVIKATPAGASVAFTGPPAVFVVGNHLVDGSGKTIRLIGVDHTGSESGCINGEGFFDPTYSDTTAFINAMKTWNINAVRVPLNEDCWLGINLPFPALGGAAYQSAIASFVNDLNAAGLAVIVDLHWNAPGTQTATSGQTMADEDHAPAFWTSVASVFRGHQGVVFDLYNEPRYLPFSCLVNGGCVKKGLAVAGYNQLISDVRSTGATNVVMTAGTAFAANPTGFRKFPVTDPISQVAISVHVYNFNAAKSPLSWAKWVHMGLVAKLPFVTGEVGEVDCTPNFINQYMPWADTNGVSYLGWTWNASIPCSGPSLISDYSGTPTTFGAGFKTHIAGL